MIVPCFNEATRLNVSKWQHIVDKFETCQWVFVNDGSTDGTNQILSLLDRQNAHILDLPKNVGKGEAVRAGINHALSADESLRLSQVGYIDADGAFDLVDIEAMFVEAEMNLGGNAQHQLLIGSRVKLSGRSIKRSTMRHYLGRIIATYICYGWSSAPYDTQTGFKIFNLNPRFRAAVFEPFVTSWFFDIELILRLGILDSRGIWELPLLNWSEVSGGSIKFWSSFKIVKEILQIRILVRRHIKSISHHSEL
jgi:glycosyltransferase involved in cell wall biosynthesis